MSSCPRSAARSRPARRRRSSKSAKAASEVYAPVSGEVVAVNDALAGDPAKVNADPMGEGWFLKPSSSPIRSELDGLMDEAAYAAFVEEQG